MNRDFSPEQEGLVAVTIESFTRRKSEEGLEPHRDYITLLLSNGDYMALHSEFNRMRLTRQLDRHTTEIYQAGDTVLIVEQLIKSAVPIIIRRKVRYSTENRPMWDCKLPKDTELL